jgi:HEAT repeat protein
MVAIQALGNPQHRKALPNLAKLLHEAEDYYTIRETLLALSRLDMPESRVLIEQAAEHPSRLVRNFAKALAQKEPVGQRCAAQRLS